MNRNNGIWLLVALLLMFIFISTIVSATIPHLINLQGRLINATTNRYISGTYNFSFYIYNQLAGGNKLWSEMQDTVSVDNGLFDVVLGTVNSIDLNFDLDYWLAMEVEEDGEMSPRQRIASTGYAFMAQDLSCTDCIGTTEISDVYVLTAGDEMSGDLNLTDSDLRANDTFFNTSDEQMISLMWFYENPPKIPVYWESMPRRSNDSQTIPEFVTDLTENKVISGGMVSQVSGLIYDISPARYYIEGYLYETNQTLNVTLSQGDTDYARIDVFYLNKSRDFGVIEGVPAVRPKKPKIDKSEQVEVTWIMVPAGSTNPGEPGNGDTTQIYTEGRETPNEWQNSSSGMDTIDFQSAGAKKAGTYGIDATFGDTNDKIYFTQNFTDMSVQAVLWMWVNVQSWATGSLTSDDFNDGDYTGWTVVDEGNRGSSSWDASSGTLIQSGNMYSRPYASPWNGTYLLLDAGAAWTDYMVNVTMKSTDDDMLGVMFRYTGSADYYRFRWSLQEWGSYRRVLEKNVGGTWTDLAYDNAPYSQDIWYNVKINLDGTNIKVSVDDSMIFNISDSSHSQGRVALYAWNDQNAYFDNVEIIEIDQLKVQWYNNSIAQGNDINLEDYLLKLSPDWQHIAIPVREFGSVTEVDTLYVTKFGTSDFQLYFDNILLSTSPIVSAEERDTLATVTARGAGTSIEVELDGGLTVNETLNITSDGNLTTSQNLTVVNNWVVTQFLNVSTAAHIADMILTGNVSAAWFLGKLPWSYLRELPDHIANNYTNNSMYFGGHIPDHYAVGAAGITDEMVTAFVNRTGDTMTGDLNTSAMLLAQDDIRAYSGSGFVNITASTGAIDTTGTLTIHGAGISTYTGAEFANLTTSGGVQITGDLDIDGGYGSGGLSLRGDTGFFRTVVTYFINYTTINNVQVNGSFLPADDETFYLGNDTLPKRWKGAFIGTDGLESKGDIKSYSGSGYVNISSSGQINVSGGMTIGDNLIAKGVGTDEYIFHNADTDNYVGFTVDEMDFWAGGINFLEFDETDTDDTITFNPSNDNVDFKIMDDNAAIAFFVQGSDGYIGIKDSSPTSPFTVHGDIKSYSGSGYVNITASTGDINISGDLRLEGGDIRTVNGNLQLRPSTGNVSFYYGDDNSQGSATFAQLGDTTKRFWFLFDEGVTFFTNGIQALAIGNAQGIKISDNLGIGSIDIDDVQAWSGTGNLGISGSLAIGSVGMPTTTGNINMGGNLEAKGAIKSWTGTGFVNITGWTGDIYLTDTLYMGGGTSNYIDYNSNDINILSVDDVNFHGGYTDGGVTIDDNEVYVGWTSLYYRKQNEKSDTIYTNDYTLNAYSAGKILIFKTANSERARITATDITSRVNINAYSGSGYVNITASTGSIATTGGATLGDAATDELIVADDDPVLTNLQSGTLSTTRPVCYDTNTKELYYDSEQSGDCYNPAESPFLQLWKDGKLVEEIEFAANLENPSMAGWQSFNLENWELSDFDIKIQNRKPEIDYIDTVQIVLFGTFADQKSGALQYYVLEPSVPELKQQDGKNVILRQGDEVGLRFDPIPNGFITYSATFRSYGYYVRA